jgi:hypothetical protein
LRKGKVATAFETKWRSNPTTLDFVVMTTVAGRRTAFAFYPLFAQRTADFSAEIAGGWTFGDTSQLHLLPRFRANKRRKLV